MLTGVGAPRVSEPRARGWGHPGRAGGGDAGGHAAGPLPVTGPPGSWGGRAPTCVVTADRPPPSTSARRRGAASAGHRRPCRRAAALGGSRRRGAAGRRAGTSPGAGGAHAAAAGGPARRPSWSPAARPCPGPGQTRAPARAEPRSGVSPRPSPSPRGPGWGSPRGVSPPRPPTRPAPGSAGPFPPAFGACRLPRAVRSAAQPPPAGSHGSGGRGAECPGRAAPAGERAGPRPVSSRCDRRFPASAQRHPREGRRREAAEGTAAPRRWTRAERGGPRTAPDAAKVFRLQAALAHGTEKGALPSVHRVPQGGLWGHGLYVGRWQGPGGLRTDPGCRGCGRPPTLPVGLETPGSICRSRVWPSHPGPMPGGLIHLCERPRPAHPDLPRRPSPRLLPPCPQNPAVSRKCGGRGRP